MRKTAFLVAALVLGEAGCFYAAGSISYVQNPELRTVRLYTGRPDPAGKNLGAVELIREGWGDCSELGTQALAALLIEARALGGTGLKDVKFRGRYHWMGSMVCRRSLLGSSVQVRGIATR